MISLLKKHNKLNESIFLFIITILCIAFSFFRASYTDTKTFLFLNWNLFLAFVPWVLTTIVVIVPKLKSKILITAILLVTWLLFFPNAPYILTDLFHLRIKTGVPIWFDLTLILFFAWTGLLYGFMSLKDIEGILFNDKREGLKTIVSTALLFIASFGIYVGRYLRWNSWDIVSQPGDLLYELGDRIINPLTHPGTWGMTIFMGLFLNVVYWSFRIIKK